MAAAPKQANLPEYVFDSTARGRRVDANAAQTIVAGGAVAVGMAAILWAVRVSDGARGAIAKAREESDKKTRQIERYDSMFGAHPGVVLVWEQDPAQASAVVSVGDWGQPRTYGSPLALAALLRFADAASANDPAVRILQGLAAMPGQDPSGAAAYLAPAIAALRRDGAPFSMQISTAQGVFVEVDGRTAGSRAIVWIIDSSVRGLEESAGRGRLTEARAAIARDPAAFLEMVDKAPFPAWRVSGAGKLEWANAAYVAALDAKSAEQAAARNVQLDPLAADQARRAIELGDRVDETRAVAIGGQRRSMRIVCFPIAGGVGGMAFDVTDAEAASEALAKAAKAHDETLDALAEAVVVFGPDKRLIFHNSAFAKLWGLDPGFLAERPSHAAWLDHLKEKRKLPAHPNYAEWRATELADYQERAALLETLWQLPEGKTLRVVKQRHPHGGILLIFSDMTNELTLKSQYNALLQVQRAALDKLHEGIVVFGLDGRMRLSNAAFRQMWSLEEQDLEGEVDFASFVRLLEPLYHDRNEWALVKARITDPSPEARQEYRGEMRRSDGVIVTFLTRPLPDGATLIAFLDVTAAKRVEDALRDRAEAFEAADRLKTEFVENVSVQLRTPLQTIQGYAEVLSKFMAGPLNDRQRDQIGMILAASESLSKLIDNILDVAMIDAGHMKLELSDVALKDTLTEAVGMAASKIRDTEVPIKIVCPADVGAIRADAKRLKQIIVNLVSNAIRFTDRGDSIVVGAERKDGVIRLWVSDTGRGMSPDDQAEAFDNFVSGDRRGAGLGLALVRSFVELHGGWVALKSEAGKGTTVTCYLPSQPPGGERRVA